MFHKKSNLNQQGRWQEEVTFSFLSSNNPDFFITKKGYVICVNELVFYLKEVHVSLQFLDYFLLWGWKVIVPIWPIGADKSRLRPIISVAYKTSITESEDMLKLLEIKVQYTLDSNRWKIGRKMWEFVLICTKNWKGFEKCLAQNYDSSLRYRVFWLRTDSNLDRLWKIEWNPFLEPNDQSLVERAWSEEWCHAKIEMEFQKFCNDRWK